MDSDRLTIARAEGSVQKGHTLSVKHDAMPFYLQIDTENKNIKPAPYQKVRISTRKEIYIFESAIYDDSKYINYILKFCVAILNTLFARILNKGTLIKI